MNPYSDAQSYYPITLTQLGSKQVVVFGGGAVATRKVGGLLAAGAHVTVVSPSLSAKLTVLAGEGKFIWLARKYRVGDCEGKLLVFAATDDRTANAQIAAEAEQFNLLCNVADDPAAGTFHLPAVYRGDGCMVAVSSYGDSPTRAKTLRDKIKKFIQEGIVDER